MANRVLSRLQNLVQVLYHLRVLLLYLILGRRLCVHVLLVEFHDADNIGFVVFGADDLVDILREFEANSFFVFSFSFLPAQVFLQLLHLAGILGEAFGLLLDFAHLLVEHLLQVEQLALQVVDLHLLRLQRLAHLARAVGQHVLTLAQILDLEFVLVQIRLALFQLLNYFPVLLLEQQDLLRFLVERHLRPQLLVFAQLVGLHVLLLLVFELHLGGIPFALASLQLIPLILQVLLLVLVAVVRLHNFHLVLIVLRLQFLLVVVLQHLGGALGILHLLLHLQQVRLKLLHQLADSTLVLRLDLGDALLVGLSQF